MAKMYPKRNSIEDGGNILPASDKCTALVIDTMNFIQKHPFSTQNHLKNINRDPWEQSWEWHHLELAASSFPVTGMITSKAHLKKEKERAGMIENLKRNMKSLEQ